MNPAWINAFSRRPTLDGTKAQLAPVAVAMGDKSLSDMQIRPVTYSKYPLIES